jgi:hypothetical protein
LEAEFSELHDNYLKEIVNRDIGLEYIPKLIIHVQKYFKRSNYGLYMRLNTSVQKFVDIDSWRLLL